LQGINEEGTEEIKCK